MKKCTKLFNQIRETRHGVLTLLLSLTCMFLTTSSQAQIAQRGTATTSTSTNTNITINRPTGVVSGDLMLVNIAKEGNNTTLPSLTGWTSIDGRSLAGGTQRYGAVLYKVAGASEPTSYTFALGTGTTSASGGIVAFSGVDTAGGIFDVASGLISVSANGTTAVSASTKTTATANTAVVMFGQAAGSNPSWNSTSWSTTDPGALTELFDITQGNSSSGSSAGAAWKLKSSIGATGVGAAVLSAAERNGAILIVLKRLCPPPTITTTGTANAVCFNASAQTTSLANTATTNSPTSYAINWDSAANTAGLSDQTTTANTFVAGAGNMTNIAIPAGVPAGTYNGTLTISNAGGCSNTQALSLTINPLPVANAGSAFTKTCSTNVSGATIGEANVAGFTYSWSPSTGLSSSTVSNPTANPTITTTYTVTKTNTTTGCSATASVTVTVDNTVPTVAAGANFTKTCTLNPTGKVIGETAVAGNTYSWSPATGLSSASVANPTANPTATTTYTVTKTTTANGCAATASITVTVDTVSPTVNAGSAFTKTCVSNINGATIGEANVAGFTYSWSPTTGLSSSTISNPMANPTTTTTYTVTKTNSTNGCSVTGNVTVTVNNTLTVTAGADFTKTCVTNPTGKVIGEANVAGNTYSWSPSTGLSDPNISNPTANPAASTSYTVTKTNTASGCVAIATINVTVNLTTSTVNAGTDFIKTCVSNATGSAIGEIAQSGYTYSWSPTTGLSSSTVANPTANPTTTTTYTVTKSNSASGCTSTDSVTVTVDTTTPTVAALTGAQTVCAGSTTVFSSTTPGGTWGTSNAGIATVVNGTITGVAAGTTNINYTVTGANGCTTTVSRSVNVNPLPTSVVASGSASICFGNNTNLTGSATIPYSATTTPINENFNGVSTFIAAGTGTIFAQKNSGDVVGLTTITNNVDASKYMMASTSSFGSATTTSTLTSPAINTNGLSTLSYTYNHSYTKGNSGTNTAVVQVSIDNINWITVKTYTTNQGASNNFVADNINLDAYVNNAALRIRFNTTISVNFGTGWWAIENPKLTATAPIAANYSWTADTASGVNGLPAGAGTPSGGNNSITVNPTSTTLYNVVATDPLTGCNVTSSSVQVIVKPLPTVTAPSNQIYCNGDTIAVMTLSGTSGATYDISGGAAIGLANADGVTVIPSYSAITGNAIISITPKLNGCTGTTVTYTVTVNPTTTTGNVTTSICEGASYIWPANGQSYTTAQTGTTFVSGCNTATLNLAVIPNTTNGDVTTSICVGSSYTWPANGQSYTTAQTGTTFVSGCNTATLNLSITPLSTVGSLTTSACDTYTWSLNSQTYTTSGTYLHVVGCNTATLNLTIVPSTTEGSLTTSACDTYTWSENGQTYTSTGVFTNVIGCNTATLNLTIIPSSTVGSQTVNACASYTWSENGQTYTSSGVYTHVVGCNTATLNLTVNTNPLTFYADSDGDGFGAGAAILSCTGQPANTSTNNTDCAPANALKWRTANLYIDADGDGFNNGFPATPVCFGAAIPTGFVSANNGVDCDDASATANPNASEVMGNGIDDNCDGVVDEVTPTSNLVASSCGITLTNFSNGLFAYDLATFVPQLGPIQGYRFRVTNGATVRTFDSPTNGFNLMNLSGGVTYGTTYTVEVSVKSGGFYRAYGTPCAINTPAVPNATFIVNPMSGSTLTDINQSIFCLRVPTASGYRFRVRNGATIVGTYSSSINRFSLVNLGISNIDFGTTYNIDVLLKFGNDWRPDTEYGPTALITTPATPGTSRVIRPTCGSTINALWTTIFAQQVVGAQGYKFVVTNGVQTREYATANPRFQLPLLSGGAAANTDYTIRVDVLYNSSYVEGTVLCTLSTANNASRQTDTALDIYDVKAYPNPYAENFKLNVNSSNEDQVQIRVYDLLGREVETRESSVSEITNLEIGAQYPSGVYHVMVSQGNQMKTLRVIKR